ncbi:nuclear migration protein nudF [Penicillium taxi]|uniref:nuclear migration protein nudF n=1 Tax=Penicillium taxi TaxID=168475 RepID=UPI00254578D0|nr:nuclear migration protein nudF [Penicillium taxi]KAJ5893948.1 nuclear migration protein nudF [Penicillium taxi]
MTLIDAPRSATTLRNELGLNDSFTEDACKQYAQILQKKWTVITTLQRKVISLESKITNLEAILQSNLGNLTTQTQRDPIKWLPGKATYTLESHRAAINCVAFHPTHPSLASGSDDFTIKIWSWEYGEFEKTLKGHTRAITGLEFGGQKDRTLLASCGHDLMIKIWDPSSEYAYIRTMVGHDHSVSCIRFLRPGENILVSASRDSSIRIWDASTGICTNLINTNLDWIYDVCPSPDGQSLVSVGRDQAATIWDLTTGEARTTLLGHENYIECSTYAPHASYSYLATMTGMRVSPTALNSIEFLVTAGRDKTIKLWDSRGVLIKTFIGHNNWVKGLVFHPGGRFLLSVADDGTIRCWDLAQEGRLSKTIEVSGGFFSCIGWAPSTIHSDKEDPGEVELRCVVATGSADSRLRVFM